MLTVKIKHQKYNKKVKEEIEKKEGMTLKDYADSKGGVYLSGAFECSHCGARLPYPVIKFFDYQVDQVRCYKCQGL